jgi:transposase
VAKLLAKWRHAHRHNEWLKFLKKLDSEITEDLSIHLIVDNYSTHKHQKVRDWLERHPRFHLHFTPTSASWMNMVERFFRDLSQQAILPGNFFSDRLPSSLTPSIFTSHNITWNQNATSGMPTAKKFSTKYTEHGKRPRIPPLIKAI